MVGLCSFLDLGSRNLAMTEDLPGREREQGEDSGFHEGTRGGGEGGGSEEEIKDEL